jgi:hypothetical protein
MLPWGPLSWLGKKLPTSSHRPCLIACVASEDRCIAVPSMAAKFSSVLILKVTDPPSKHSAVIESKTMANLQKIRDAGSTVGDPHQLGLLADDQSIADSLLEYLSSVVTVDSETDLWIDISCLPKRFFFLLVKLALAHRSVRTFVVTYTQPSLGLYTEEHLAEDPDDVRPLPGFGPQFGEPNLLIVGIGFEALGLPQFLGEYRDKKREIALLLPFPPGQPYSRRTWETVMNIGFDGSYGSIRRVATVDVFGSYSQLCNLRDPFDTQTQNNPPALAPYGPKPMSLGMCLYAIDSGAPAFYTQPRMYHPDYSRGVGTTWAYCLKLNGNKTWHTAQTLSQVMP